LVLFVRGFNARILGWHTATLILLGLALLTAFLSICIGFCACCYGSLALIFTVLTLVTTFLSAIAIGLFFFYSHRADNRFIKGIVGTYEQRVGLAFYLQMVSCLFHFLAFLVSLLFSFFALTRKGEISDRYSLNKSSKTITTNVGRSMEYMPQTMYQQNLTSANVRPPYYSKQQQYEKTVAGSMPELGITHSPSDIVTERVRRKSETCV
uniref:MARVEL domain-containing protein n=1 Tax=Syphacia muris TaxID=451379 RepID=A0A0N5AXT9_9BILA